MAQTKITGDMIADDAVTADKIANSINSAITANTAKVTNATHTGDVTGATALTIAVDAVDIPMLSATGSPSSTTFLRGDNAWVAPTNTDTVYTHPNHSGEVTSTADGATVIIDDVVDEANLKISNAGSNGQVLSKQSGNTGGLTWATVGGAYSDWAIITTNTTLVAKGQYICNDSSARTHTLPAGSSGDTVILANAGAGLVTIGRNGSEKINSAAADGTIPQGNSAQLVYVDATIGWFEV